MHGCWLSYLPVKAPKIGLTLNVDDWKSAISCDFCDQLFLPGQQLSFCQDSHTVSIIVWVLVIIGLHGGRQCF